MKKIAASIILFLCFFLSACELKDDETKKERCEERQRELAVLSIAQCGLSNNPGTSAYNTCVNILLIAFMDNIAQCSD